MLVKRIDSTFALNSYKCYKIFKYKRKGEKEEEEERYVNKTSLKYVKVASSLNLH